MKMIDNNGNSVKVTDAFRRCSFTVDNIFSLTFCEQYNIKNDLRVIYTLTQTKWSNLLINDVWSKIEEWMDQINSEQSKNLFH